MKTLLTISVLVISTITYGQSKKELKAELHRTQQQLYTARQNVKTYKTLSNTWKDRYSVINNHNITLNKSLNDLTDQLINILPHLTVSEGFPEKFYPEHDNIQLFNEVNPRGYGSADTSIFSGYNCEYYPSVYPGEPDSVVLLGVIDSTLSKDYHGEIIGALPVLYDNKIRFTSLHYLSGSKASKKVKSYYEKKILIDEYGEEIGSKIYAGIPWIGMSFSALYEMFGVHDDLNTYESAYGKVYSYTYRSSYETYVITVQNRKVTEIMKL